MGRKRKRQASGKVSIRFLRAGGRHAFASEERRFLRRHRSRQPSDQRSDLRRRCSQGFYFEFGREWVSCRGRPNPGLSCPVADLVWARIWRRCSFFTPPTRIETAPRAPTYLLEERPPLIYIPPLALIAWPLSPPAPPACPVSRPPFQLLQEDLKHPDVIKAVDHWTGRCRLSQDDADDLMEDNFRCYIPLKGSDCALIHTTLSTTRCQGSPVIAS